MRTGYHFVTTQDDFRVDFLYGDGIGVRAAISVSKHFGEALGGTVRLEALNAEACTRPGRNRHMRDYPIQAGLLDIGHAILRKR